MGRRMPTIQKDKDRFYKMRMIVSYFVMFSHLNAGKVIRKTFAEVGWDY